MAKNENAIKIFATNMRLRRKELKMTQEKLGELSGLHRTYIGGIEQFSRNPSMRSMEKIAKALDVDVAALSDKKYSKFQNKYTLCVKDKNGKYNFYPINEDKLSEDEIAFLENWYL